MSHSHSHAKKEDDVTVRMSKSQLSEYDGRSTADNVEISSELREELDTGTPSITI
jgi:hypothetical protein